MSDGGVVVILPALAGPHLHLLLSSCGPFGVIPDGVCNFFGGASSAVSQALEIIQNPFRWLYHHTLGAPVPQHPGDPGWDACQADWSQPACPKLIDQLKPADLTLSQSWPRLYSEFSVSGVFIAMTCGVVRVVRGVFDDGAGAMHLVVDNVVRAVVASGLLVAPTPDNSLLLNIMRLSASASGRIAAAAGGAVASATIFYVVSNFAMWTSSTLYPHTLDGLIVCYIAAIPFYGTMLLGDVLYSALLFGTFVWAERRLPRFAAPA